MARLAMMMFALLPLSAQGGTLHRCVTPAGAVSYQSANCGTGQRLDRLIAYVPESDPKPAPPARRASTAKRSSGTSNRTYVRTGDLPRKRTDHCVQARQKRSASLERLGLRRTFDQLSRLDAAVRTACKGY